MYSPSQWSRLPLSCILNTCNNSSFIGSHISHVLLFLICLKRYLFVVVCGGLVFPPLVAPSFAVFRDATKFNQDLSKWDMSQVGNTGSMMASTTKFDQGVWCTSSWNKFAGALSMTGKNRVFCCNPGRFLNKSDPLAKEADESWTLTDGNSCPKCLEGQYTDSLNLHTSCIRALRDTFVPAKGLTVATNCPKNSFTNPPNTTMCEICPAGYKMIRGTTATNCSKCDAGKFQNVPGSETCKDCPEGFYQNVKFTFPLDLCSSLCLRRFVECVERVPPQRHDGRPRHYSRFSVRSLFVETAGEQLQYLCGGRFVCQHREMVLGDRNHYQKPMPSNWGGGQRCQSCQRFHGCR